MSAQAGAATAGALGPDAESGEGVRAAMGPSRRALLAGGAALPASLAALGRASARTLAQAAAGDAGAPLTEHATDLMLKTLAAAPSHGFPPDEFAPADLAARVQAGDPAAVGLLRSAIFAYARAQHGLRLPLGDFLVEWGVRPVAYDPAPDFAQALAGGTLQAWLDGLPPPYQGYNGLRTGLARYRAIAAAHGWKPIPDGPPLQAGTDDPRVTALRRRLAAETPDALEDVDSTSFDDAVTQAVTAFQTRYGLVSDGVVGPPTLAALNAPVGERIQEIKANMERWRWLPRELPPSRIQVNIAAAVMAVYENDRPVLAMKAVAGRPDDATPMLQSEVNSIVLNPPWHVPVSIADKEIWPKARVDKGYLARHGYEVRRLDDGVLHVIQKSGPKSALGRFKFDFPNPYGVYLHDTPVQSGFSHTSRLASHGCVRLEHPEALADLLLAGDADWPADRVAQVVTTDKTIRAPLPSPMPVFILYFTAFVVAGGEIAFRTDSYDWDRKLTELLAAQGRRDDAPHPAAPSATPIARLTR